MSVHLERAQVLVDLRRVTQAEEELRRALAQEPNNSTAHRLLAWCQAMQGHLQQAQAEAEEAIRLQPDLGASHHILGWILLKQGRWKEAEKALREAIRLDPRSATNFFLLADLFGQQKHWSNCAEAAREGLRIDPDDVACAKILAEALFKMKHHDEAQEILNDAMTKEPENAWAHLQQALLYLERNELEKSLYHVREAARIAPENPDIDRAIKILGSRRNPCTIILAHISSHVVNFLLNVFRFLVWGQRPKKP